MNEGARPQLIIFQGFVVLLRFIFSMKQRPNMLCVEIRHDSVLMGTQILCREYGSHYGYLKHSKLVVTKCNDTSCLI